MEIIFFVVAVGALVYVGYKVLNQERSDGSHPLDGATQAPYKIETPETSVKATPCGCGRSSSGFCVGLHKLSAEEWAAHPDNKSAAEETTKPVKSRGRSKKTKE